uniref:Uncharacterized protein n=1 Tax=Strigamia maritima TaxID=126957 RepID=T1IU33_STRMM
MATCELRIREVLIRQHPAPDDTSLHFEKHLLSTFSFPHSVCNGPPLGHDATKSFGFHSTMTRDVAYCGPAIEHDFKVMFDCPALDKEGPPRFRLSSLL